MEQEKLENGKFYHIYNHAVGGRQLFLLPENYEHFLSIYDKYISPIAETYAWASKHFSHLFNAYGKYLNKRNETRGQCLNEVLNEN